jgi:CCR4-NOT transcriptional regulation complex NOT5 subunit
MQTELEGPPPEDPLVKVKEQEIQAKAAADAAKDQNDKQRIQLEGQRVQGDLAVDQAKLQLDSQKLQQQGFDNANKNSQARENAQLQAFSRAQKGGNTQR